MNPKIADFIERLRAKPEHVRRRIAFTTAAGASGVVGAVWLIALVISGSLALSTPSIPDSGSTGSDILSQSNGTQVVGAVAQTQSAFSELLGAVGAANATTSAPSLKIEDVSAPDTSSHANPNDTTGGSQTVIPF